MMSQLELNYLRNDKANFVFATNLLFFASCWRQIFWSDGFAVAIKKTNMSECVLICSSYMQVTMTTLITVIILRFNNELARTKVFRKKLTECRSRVFTTRHPRFHSNSISLSRLYEGSIDISLSIKLKLWNLCVSESDATTKQWN